MKTLKLLFAIATITIFSFNETNAQIQDTLFWVKAPIIENARIIDWNSTFAISNKSIISAPISTKAKPSSTLKKVKLIPAKQIKTPYVVKYKGSCYAIGCAKSSSCKECEMYWRDLNGDKKVQPKKELRCICIKGNTACKITAKRTNCR